MTWEIWQPRITWSCFVSRAVDPEPPGWPCMSWLGWNMPISKKQGRMIYRFLIALTAIRR